MLYFAATVPSTQSTVEECQQPLINIQEENIPQNVRPSTILMVSGNMDYVDFDGSSNWWAGLEGSNTVSISPSSRLGGTSCFPRWDQPSWFPQLLGRVHVSHRSHMSGQHLAYLSGEGNAENTWESPSRPRVATQKSLHSQSRGR